MSGNRFEGLLSEVDTSFEEFTVALQELANLKTHAPYTTELVEVIDAVSTIQNWLAHRKAALQLERHKLANQIIERELNRFEGRRMTRKSSSSRR